MLICLWSQSYINMALSFAKWLVSAVAKQKCGHEYICRLYLWVMCSAKQYVHNIKDLLTK